MSPLPPPQPPPEPDLLLVFPQWQGAGQLPRLRDSALALAAALPPDRRRLEVAVEPGHPLSIEHGIAGRSELLAQLAAARRLLKTERPARVFAVGGDCGIETVVVSYLNARYAGSLAVVWLDAHPDLNTPESSPSGHFHGMPLRILLGEGDAKFTALVERPLRPDQLLLAGTRAPDPPERALIEAGRIRSLSTESLLDGPGELLRWVRGTGLARVYVHLDLDVCDPREVPTVACPTPGGLAVSALLEILRMLGRETSIVGVGLTEAMFEGAAVPPALRPILDWFGRQ